MGKEISTFGYIEIEKKLCRNSSPTLFKKCRCWEVLVANKIPFSVKNYKCFIGCLYNDNKVKPLHILPPKTRAYVKSYGGQTNWMYFLIEDDDF